MKKLRVFIIIFLNSCLLLFAQNNEEMLDIKERVNSYYYHDNYKNWELGVSSYLKDNNKISDFYCINKAFDNDLETAWVEGKNGSGVGEFILLQLYQEGLFGNEYFNIKNNSIKANIKINNGYCKNENLFFKNNRVKKAKITIYDMSLRVGMNDTSVDDIPEIVYQEIIELKDVMEEQNFSFSFKLKNVHTTSTPEIILKFEIIDVYKGTTYDDTAISEINVYGEYIED